MRSFALACSLGAVLCTDVRLQSFEIHDQNVRLVRHPRAVPGLFSSAFSATPCAESHLHGNEWCYTVPGSGVGRAIDSLGNGSYARQAIATNVMEQQVHDLDALALFDVVLFDVVVSIGEQSGILTSAARFTNIAATPQRIRVYNFANVDLNDTCCGEYGDYTLDCSTPRRLVIADEEDCGGFVVYGAPTAQRYAIDAPAALAAVLRSGATLADAGLPFASAVSPGDFAAAFEWDAALAPGESLLCEVRIESLRATAMSALRHVGHARGGVHTPTIHSSSTPRVGRDFVITAADLGIGPAVLLLGLALSPPLVAVHGVDLLAPPLLAALALDITSGTASTTITIVCDPALGGVTIASQAITVDPTSPAPLPLSHSDVLVAQFGD